MFNEQKRHESHIDRMKDDVHRANIAVDKMRDEAVRLQSKINDLREERSNQKKQQES
jgi:phage shock protein A